MEVDSSIFRAYDIRGIYGKNLTEDAMEKIGNVVRRFIKDRLIVGRDCRLSSPSLMDSFIRGARKAGIDVIDIGMVPRGASMLWCWKKGIPCAYITASHLPKEWNGVKFIFPDGTSLGERVNSVMLKMISNNEFLEEGDGKLERVDVLPEYEKFLTDNIPAPKRKLKVLLDCGNGTAGIVAENVFRKKGYVVESLFKEPDGRFPNRQSELKPEFLKAAQKEAGKYDMVFAFDGDADRIAMIDNGGTIVKPEILAYVIVKELLRKEKGPIVANVECSNIVDEMAREFGRKLYRTRVGYAFVLKKVLETKASVGIENSMHFSIPSILPFDDGILATLYAAYSISRMDGKLSDFIGSVPEFFYKKVNFECESDEIKERAMQNLRKRLVRDYEKTNLLDGVRVDLEKGWALVRQSNTEPLIRLSLEAGNKVFLEELENIFTEIIRSEIGEK